MHKRIRNTLAAVGIVGLVVAGLTQMGPAASSAPGHPDRPDSGSRPVVSTDSGAVRGDSRDRAEQFLGIPYAAPPLRDLRFAPPAEPESWRGVREADAQSPACIQFEPSGIREEQAVSEDCLYLDVYRPSHTRPSDDLPVMVWFHGGANTQGTGVIYGGSTMAETTDTVVISVNYRLGALGFLAHPALTEATPGGSGNYGRMDQLASLEWVQENAESFGGDPDNVTIYGQSAGGQAVCDLMATPSAAGLFHRGIVQSQQCLMNRATLAEGEQVGEQYAQAVGCTEEADVVECLRGAWPGTLVAEQGIVRGGAKTGGELIPTTFAEAVENDTWNRVPLITGTTYSENRLGSEEYVDVTPEGFEDWVREEYPDRADQVLDIYPLAEYDSPWDAITQIETDEGRACPNLRFASLVADKTPTYRYEFNDPTSPTLYGFEIPDKDMSNAHSAELAYLFDFTLGERPLTREQERLSDQMMRYWGAFAHDGEPHARRAPQWPTFDGEQVLQLRTGGDSEVITSFADEHHCDFWLD